METFIWAIVPLMISGLAFITYKHPLIARKIIIITIAIEMGVFVILTIYYMANSNAYAAGLRAMNIEIYKHVPIYYNKEEWNTDNADTLRLLRDALIKNNRYDKEVDINERKVKDSIRSNIITLFQANRDQQEITIKSMGIAAAILAIFYFLSKSFDNLGKPNSKKQDNSPDQTTE